MSLFHLFSHQEKTLHKQKPLYLTGIPQLKLADIVAVARDHLPVEVQLAPKIQERHTHVLHAIHHQIERGLPIYGVTTAYGARASDHHTMGKASERLKAAQQLSEAILHVDVSTGPLLPHDVVRAAMLIRLNMLLPGYSGIRLESLAKLHQLIEQNVTPQVNAFGTVGASGDLALNGRVLSVLLHRPEALVTLPNGTVLPAPQALSQHGISPLQLAPKEGLAFVNGDNFSTAYASLLFHDLTSLFFLNLQTIALTIQALCGTNRNFHPLLSLIRPHPGQKTTSAIFRYLLKDSHLALQEMKGAIEKQPGINIQDAYSIRCLPQYFGPDYEALESILQTITINSNSVSDNPLWTTPETASAGEEPYQWVSGGNFLAMHMAEVNDRLRKIAIHIVKQNDRHLNRLVNPHLNNGLPANLSDPAAISQCTFKGLQTQMGMYEVYASVLAAPISTAFGIHEELNQDITSHAITSAIMTRQVLDMAYYAVATNLIASCQAIDLRGGPHLLSPPTISLYEWVRQLVPYVKKEQPLGHFVEKVATAIKINSPSFPLIPENDV